MNFVESTTWDTIREYLAERDAHRTGWAIDVGIGDDDYYFEWLCNLGYRTVAVEPLPTDKARQALQDSGATFIEAALGSGDGRALMHTARGIHSLYEGLWGVAESDCVVRTITWRTLLAETGIDHISLLKLDVEGAESMIIRQISVDVLPDVLSFEFGGVWDQGTRQGPWSEQRIKMFMGTLAVLEVLGYSEAVMISSGAQDKAERSTLAQIREGGWVDPQVNWGNIVTVLEERYE